MCSKNLKLFQIGFPNPIPAKDKKEAKAETNSIKAASSAPPVTSLAERSESVATLVARNTIQTKQSDNYKKKLKEL